MAENSKIEWTHHTINFWWGCAKVSPACANCYAEGQADRFQGGLWGPDRARRVRIEAAAKEAMRYQRRAFKEGTSFRIFSNSMSDFFEDRRDLDQPRMEALDVIRKTPNLHWLILTKRPEKIRELLNRVHTMIQADLIVNSRTRFSDLRSWIYDWLENGNAPANVWLGTTVEDQEHADQRIPALLEVPAAIRFLSCEPLLGPVNLHRVRDPNPAIKIPGREITFDALSRKGGIALHDGVGLDWVICGGESGLRARPMHPGWVQDLRDQCEESNVPFLFKQWGEWLPTGQTPDLQCKLGNYAVIHQPHGERHKGGSNVERVGKRFAGRSLDGRLHDAYPEILRKRA